MSLGIANSTERLTGVAMDRPLPRRHPNYPLISTCVILLLGAVLAIAELVPRGLPVAASDIRIATVRQGIFHNDILVRSTAQPLRTVVLDAFESGRVEEILANDGGMVEAGELLFRLSNPQLRLSLVAREADRA